MARLYGYKNGTKDLNKLINRNIEKFSINDYFQLNDEEFEDLQFQFGTANEKFSKTRTLPFVLTKEGILILSKLIKKDNITLINSQLLEVFDKENFTPNEFLNHQILPKKTRKNRRFNI